MDKSNLPLFISLLLINFLSFSTYGIPITFFPNIAEIRGISDLLSGFIFAMYPLGAFFCGFIVGKMLTKWERKRVIISSQILMGISILIFGLSDLSQNNIVFIIVALVTRATQGIALGSCQTAAYAFIPEYWPDEIDFRIGLLEVTVGFGIGTGPLIGALIYSMWGYLSIYIAPGILITFFGSILAYMTLPMNKKQEEHEKTEETLSLSKTFSSRDMWYTFFVLVINYGGFTLIMPDLENKVIKIGGSPEMASILFACNQVGYILAIAFLMIYKIKNRKGIFFVSLIFSLLSLILLGFDSFFIMSNEMKMVLIGLGTFISGIVGAFSLVPFVSESITILHSIFPDKKRHLLDNMASGLFTAAISLAEFHGPILGGFLTQNFGFSDGCLIYSVVVFLFFIVFATHGRGMKAMIEWGKGKRKEVKVKENEKGIEVKLLETNIL